MRFFQVIYYLVFLGEEFDGDDDEDPHGEDAVEGGQDEDVPEVSRPVLGVVANNHQSSRHLGINCI